MWKVLSPDPRGHLTEIPEDQALPLKSYATEDMPNRFDDMFDDDSDVSTQVPDSPSVVVAVPMLDSHCKYIVSLLRTRERLADFERIKTLPMTSRDEIIESLTLGCHNIGERVQTSVQPDQRIIDLVSGNKIDRLTEQAKLADEKRAREADRKIEDIKRIDKARIWLPIHLQRMIDLMYYKRQPVDAVKRTLKITQLQYDMWHAQAITQISDKMGRY